MYKIIYQLLKQQLLAKIPEVKEIAFYRGQDKKKKGMLKILPGAYIKFLPTELKSIGNGIQQGEVEFEIYLITDCMYDDDKRYTDSSNLNHLDIVNKIHLFLEGHSAWISDLSAFAALKDTDNDYKPFNSIDRTDIETDDDNDAYFITVQKFKMFCKDYTANRAWVNAAGKTLDIQNFSFDI